MKTATRLGLIVSIITAIGISIFAIINFLDKENKLSPLSLQDFKNKEDFAKNSPYFVNNSQSMEKTDSLAVFDKWVLTLLENKALSNKDKFDALWVEYKKNRLSNHVIAGYFLDSVQGLEPLPNIGVLLTELNDSTTPSEIKIHLMRLIGRAHQEFTRAEMMGSTIATINNDEKEAINVALKKNIYNTNSSIAREAVLVYSRIGSTEEALYSLLDAYKRNIISEAEFVRESSSDLPNMRDPQKQHAMMSNLIDIVQNSRSQESRDALMESVTSMLENQKLVALVGTESRNSLVNFLKENEPKIPFLASEHDALADAKYSSWLNGYANLVSKTENEKNAFFLNTIINESTDTQKIIAVLVSPQADGVINAARANNKLKMLQNRIGDQLSSLIPGSPAHLVYQAVLSVLN
jgi:hypothetical protein